MGTRGAGTARCCSACCLRWSEARDGGKSYLIPIRLDDYLFSGWNSPKPGMAQEVRERVVADFRGADTDDAKFDAQLLRLLDALKKARP